MYNLKGLLGAFAIGVLAMASSFGYAQEKVVVVPMLGSNGVSGYEIITETFSQTNVPIGIPVSTTAVCPRGKVIVGGGVSTDKT
jgi:hypothetical protein